MARAYCAVMGGTGLPGAAHFSGITVVDLALVIVPNCGAKWLRRSLGGGKPPTA